MTRRRRRRCRTKLAAGLPQGRLEVIAGCAHVPQLQSPGWLLDAIGDFLPGTNAAPSRHVRLVPRLFVMQPKLVN